MEKKKKLLPRLHEKEVGCGAVRRRLARVAVVLCRLSLRLSLSAVASNFLLKKKKEKVKKNFSFFFC
jgi:hypothetical protein